MKFGTLPTGLKSYVALVILAGVVALGAVLALPFSGNWWLVAALVICSIVFSAWKVELTILSSQMTLASAVVCLAMLLQGELAAALCAGVGAIVGTVLRVVPGRWMPSVHLDDYTRAAFNAGNCVVSCTLAAVFYRVVYEWVFGMAGADFPARVAGIMVYQTMYFLANTAGVSVALSLLKKQRVFKIWRDNFLWTAPSYYASASLAVGIHWVFTHTVVGAFSVVLLSPAYFIFYSYRIYMDRMNLYVEKLELDQRHIKELNELNSAIIASLAMAIDAKDRHTRSHINRVQMYAVALAEAAGCVDTDIEAVRIGALVHDIGKLGIPERILGKPGKLSPDEFRRMQAHVTIGAEILAPVNFPWPVKDIVLTHHERWDGLGYPKGLRAEDIYVGGRILAIADVFDALTSNRPYRRALCAEEALAVLKDGAGKQFDPHLVDIFERILPEVRVRVMAMESKEMSRLGEVGVPAATEPDWAFSQISQAAAEMSATCELAQGLAETSTVQEVISVAIDRALRLLPADTAVVYLCDEETGDLEAAAVGGLYKEKLSHITIGRGEGVSGWVAETLQPQVNAQASLDVGRRFNPNEVMELSAAASVPLVQGQSTLGVLTLYTTSYSVLNEHHLGVLNVMAEHAAAALASARRYELTRELSLTDPVTGLPNSRSLIHHVETLCGRWTGVERDEVTDRFAVLMFDLDGFKNVNDTVGHLRGNELLQDFGEILRELTREQDLPCRYAGDEFVVVLSDAASEQAEEFALRVREALQKRGRHWLSKPITVSIGAACFPLDGQDVRTLLAVADERMYSDKFSRRTGLPSMRAQTPAE